MPYLELTLMTDGTAQELISDWWLAEGALAVTVQSATDEPYYQREVHEIPQWNSVQLAILGPIDWNWQTDFVHCQSEYPSCQFINIQEIADQCWERAYLEYFKPLQFAKRFWILPEGSAIPENQPYLLLDPGLAFGTGTHPTTAMCLTWLAQQELSYKTLCDYGCGSGILALAACKLGATKVFAVDHDPQAILASLANAQKNALYVPQLTIGLSHEVTLTQCDILIANILASTLVMLAETLTQLLSPCGVLVLSGILINQKEEIINAYPHIAFYEEQTQEEWLCLIGQRK